MSSVKRLALAVAVLLALCCGAAVYLAEGALWIRAELRRPAPADEARTLAVAPEELQCHAADGAVLRGWGFRPQAWNGRCVLLLHGVADRRTGMLGQARWLVEAGYAVLAADSRGHGASGGEPLTYGLKERGDLSRWIDALSERWQPREFYALGASMGGAVLLQALPQEPRIRAAVAECPFASFREIAYDRVAGRMGVWPPLAGLIVEPALAYARARYGLDLREASPRRGLAVSAAPVLLIHGAEDRNIAPSHSERLYKMRPQGVTLWRVAGAGHVNSLNAAPREYRERVLRLFR